MQFSEYDRARILLNPKESYPYASYIKVITIQIDDKVHSNILKYWLAHNCCVANDIVFDIFGGIIGLFLDVI